MITNDEINALRIEAFKKHGGVIRVKRLRCVDGSLRFYICQMKGDQILSILASGERHREVAAQL